MAAPHRRRFRRRRPPAAVEQAVGRAMRIDDAVREFREQRARRRGLVPTVIPYTGYGAPGWVRVLGRVLLVGKPGGTAKPESVRGWRSFLSVAVDRQPVKVTIGDVVHHVIADRGGVIDVRLEARLEPGWHRIRLEPEGERENALPVEAPVFVLDPAAPFGIVSDIDDTVMITALPRPLLAAWNTFVLDEHARAATPGMAVVYDRLHRAHPEAPVLYLSTGAWNVAPTLTRFLSRNLYPPGPLLLTDWGPTPDRIFRSGRQHKIDELERIAQEFPEVRWLLVGDDGQHDEETYGDFAEDHPENVAAICIRRLSPGEAVLAGGRSKDGGSRPAPGVHWIYAPDGKGLAEELAKAGFL
jgi:phosphatidate phosphatase APP1